MIKTRLLEADELLKEREALTRFIRRMTSASQTSGSARMDGMPRPEPACRDAITVMDELTRAVQRREEVEADLTYLKRRLEAPIQAMQPAPVRTVMRCRYLDWMSIREIKDHTHYSRGYVYRLLDDGKKSEGLDKLDTP